MSNHDYPDALPALSRLHWYVLERVLGQGGFGITYLAKDTNLDQRVAIKEYLPVDVATRMPDSSVRSRTEELRDRYRWGLERFIQEARTLARFDHPNIVRVLSVFEFNDSAYMVMRFEEGGTLSAMLDRRGTLPEADLLRVLLPILDGLELVHNAGFIHRDIKPDNIHIAGGGRPVLLDFGSARQSLGNSHTLTILIAPGYAPFEQYYSDSSSQGPWTDIYGLGATCYRAICGRAPLDAVSRSKGILGSTQEVMVPASVVGVGRYSATILGAIDHALAFAEKDRPQTIAEWRKELTGDGDARLAAPAAAGHVARKPIAAPATTVIAKEAPPTGAERASAVLPEAAGGATRASQPIAQVTSAAFWRWGFIVAAMAIAAVAVYMVMSGRNDETRSQIQALEARLKGKETADAAEREAALNSERQAKQRAEEETRQRAAQEQALAEATKAQAQPARTREPAAKPQPTAQKPHEASAPKTAPTYVASPAKTSPSAAISSAAQPSVGATPTTTLKEAPPQTVTAISPTPPAPPESKPVRPAPAEQLADAERAIAAQRYADAIAIVKPLAEAGNAQAQVRLGDAYAEGRGVQRDAEVAEKWYEKAALQGNTGAQLKLGSMFATGNGLVRNNNLAYVWYGTAADLGSSAAKAERDKIAPLLQPAERAQADKLIAAKVEAMAKKP
ncbi:MAG TPA: protein kinase [Casimicrobiaceae bacterium]|nr:protein kinase [Casimicrobiaceae bacterium]